jgi:CheY-like chemotaxis protein
MSHEIRTPMNGVLSMAGILEKADIPEESRRQAKVIRKSGEAMMVILNDVLDLSKIEAGKLNLEARNFSPRDLVEDVAMLWEETIQQKGLGFTLEIGSPMPKRVIGDDTRLRQVLTNLMSNALKFTKSGTIALSVEAIDTGSDPILRFSVTDTGIGISKTQQKRLFEAFNQANNSISRRYGGTGLGLAISDKIVRQMGGEFTITSAPNMGSTFSFTTKVKLAKPTKKPAATAKTETTSKQEKTAQLPQRTILIAEDNEINRSVLKAFLSRLPVTLSFVENGALAVEAANAQPFDVILMDVQMPIMDGLSATRAIRSDNGPCRNAPIIALTANAMPGDQQRYLDQGMTGYVSKPIDPAALFSAIKDAKPFEEASSDVPGEQHA